MKNLVIIYSGREGSSAIVSSLGKHSEVEVPIFENMDFLNVKNKFGKDVFSKAHVAIGNLLSGLDFDDKIFDERKEEVSLKKSVVFKWRPWGDMEKVSEALKENETLVVSLARRDVVNHALSKYFTNRVVGEGKGFFHPQFHVNKLKSEERDKYIEDLRKSDFSVEVDKYIDDLRAYVDAKESMAEKVDVIRKSGVNVKELFYEDFLENKRDFLEELLEDLGLEYEGGVDKSDFRKVNRDDLRGQVLNMSDIESDPNVRSLVEKYNSLFS